jgi:hypothetical protein
MRKDKKQRESQQPAVQREIRVPNRINRVQSGLDREQAEQAREQIEGDSQFGIHWTQIRDSPE